MPDGPAASNLPRETMPDVESFELVQELGVCTEGPTAVVREAASGRRFMLKIYDKSVLRDPEFALRVRHEAAVASRLSYPSVVRVLGAREWVGDLVVVRDYVEGASLAEVLAKAKGGRLGQSEALAVALAAAAALEVGRQAGLVHDAVSLTNLLVARDGSVKLAELGVAKPRPVEPSISKTGVGIRSPAYLAPEYFELRAATDTRSDLFSLGAVLYHCLSGQAPFRGDTTAEVTFAVRNGRFIPLKEAAPEVPRSFASIVEKLLQPNPAERYQTPAELLGDLQALQAGRVPDAQRRAVAEAIKEKQEAARQEVAAPPPQPAAQPPTRANWTWVAVGAIALLVLAAGAFFVVRGGRRPPPHKAGDEVVEPDAPAADPVARARKAREELERLAKAAAAQKETDPAKRLQAATEQLERLKELEKNYAGTEAAEEARKRLRPVEAEAVLQAALLYAREKPADREGIAKRLREVVEKYRDTAAGYSAERKLDEFEDTERKKLLAQVEAARERAKGLVAKRRFGEALAAFDELLKGSPPEETRQAVLQEKIAITSEAERAYLDIHRRAQDKIAGGHYEEAKALYEQAAGAFGIEPFVGRARGELAILAPLLKSAAARRLEAIDAAKEQWFITRIEPSLALAAGWELAAATAEAEKLRAELRTAGVEACLDTYLADLALLSSLKLRVVRRLNDAAAPVAVRDFSLGKVGGRFDPQWLEARVARADDDAVLFRYGQLEVRRAWRQFPPDELYKLGVLASDPNDARAHFALGVYCFYANLPTIAAREFHLAKAGVPDADSYLKRLENRRQAERAGPPLTRQEEASRLLIEAKRYMNEQAWDRALYRLALLRDRHATKVYDVSANLDDINRRIAECKKQVEKALIEADLALGKEVAPLRESLFDEWQQRFGKWSLAKGVLAAKNTEDHDAECLFSLRHPPAYELRAKVRVLEGTGAILRLAGKARPSIGFWLHAAKPDLAGLILEQPADQQAAERKTQPFTFKLGEWYEVRATVSPTAVEAAIGDAYVVRMPNKLPPDPSGLQTYGFLVNPKSAAEFRDFTLRTLREQ